MDGRQGQAEFGHPEIDDGDGGKLNGIVRRPEDIGKDSSGDHWSALESDLHDNRFILALKTESRRYRWIKLTCNRQSPKPIRQAKPREIGRASPARLPRHQARGSALDTRPAARTRHP